MRSWIKAGLIGAVVYTALTPLDYVIYFLPMEMGSAIGYALCVPYLILGLGVGLLAAAWLEPPRTIQRAGASGALAGLLAFVISSCASLLLFALFSVATDIPQRYLEKASLASGPNWLSNPVMYVALYACGAVLGVVMFSLLGWLGGIIVHAIRGESKS